MYSVYPLLYIFFLSNAINGVRSTGYLDLLLVERAEATLVYQSNQGSGAFPFT